MQTAEKLLIDIEADTFEFLLHCLIKAIRFMTLYQFIVFFSQNCRAVMKAYEMNPFLHFPVYSFVTPLLLGYVAYHTKGIH